MALMVRVHGGHADRDHPLFLASAISAYRDPAGAIWWLCPMPSIAMTREATPRLRYRRRFRSLTTEGGIAATEDGSGALWLAAVEKVCSIGKRENGSDLKPRQNSQS